MRLDATAGPESICRKQAADSLLKHWEFTHPVMRVFVILVTYGGKAVEHLSSSSSSWF